MQYWSCIFEPIIVFHTGSVVAKFISLGRRLRVQWICCMFQIQFNMVEKPRTLNLIQYE